MTLMFRLPSDQIDPNPGGFLCAAPPATLQCNPPCLSCSFNIKCPWCHFMPLRASARCLFLHFTDQWSYFSLVLALHPTHTEHLRLPHTPVLQAHLRNPFVLLEKKTSLLIKINCINFYRPQIARVTGLGSSLRSGN